ncbi:MAG TPA: HDOD domain-containing protein [Verrucomicrobiae bacterium]
MKETYILERVHSQKTWVNHKLEEALSSEHLVPSFSRTAARLCTLVNDPNVEMDKIIEVISLDPGLVARFLKAASSAVAGGNRHSSIDEAVFRLGLKEIRRIALTVGVMGQFSHLRVKVDWSRFWLHSILVARLTERLAMGFREPTGHEYLSGLVHDIGKLVIEHSFPREFETIYLRAMERKCGHQKLEFDLLGTDHSQIGASICEQLQLHPHIISAVRYHHQPDDVHHTQEPGGDGGFLAACVAVANAMANRAQINIDGADQTFGMEFEELPEWQFLNQFEMSYGLEVDTEEECALALADLQGLN